MTKPQIIALVIAIAVAALIVDSHMPLVSFRVPVTENVVIKIAVYDKSEGIVKMLFRNVKIMIEGWRELK